MELSFVTQIKAMVRSFNSAYGMFYKFGDDVYQFDVENSLRRDWKMVSSDIRFAMHKFEEVQDEDETE